MTPPGLKYQGLWETGLEERLTRKIRKSGLAPAESCADIIRDGGKSSESPAGGWAEHGHRHIGITDRDSLTGSCSVIIRSSHERRARKYMYGRAIFR